MLLQGVEADNDAEVDPDLAYHVFVPPSALILGEPATAGKYVNIDAAACCKPLWCYHVL